MEASIAFYRDVLGLKLNRKMNPIPGTEIAFLGLGGLGSGETEVELIHSAQNPEPKQGKDISIGFMVPSVEKAMTELREKGISRISGPFQPNPMVKFIYIDDPDGVKVQLVESPKA
jgi:lactoylglutathione lyase